MGLLHGFWAFCLLLFLTGCGSSGGGAADDDTNLDSTAIEDTATASDSGEDNGTDSASLADTQGDSTSHDDTGEDSIPGTETDSTADTVHSTDTGADTESSTDTGADTASETDDTDSGSTGFRLPPANAPWDYQIGGGYPPPEGVLVVSRDREDSLAPGLYNICYVNGFQIQPNEENWWQTNHPELILRDGNGDPVVDDGWDEMLLDVRTPEKREALKTIVGGWIARCAEDGFDAVEIDNLDSYDRSNGLISQEDNITFMGMLSAVAHANGLASAQKNAAAFLDNIDEMQTDFAVVEECNRWNECGDFQDAYGDLLFIVEYRRQDFEAGCSAFFELSIVLRNIDVSTPASSNYVYDGC